MHRGAVMALAVLVALVPWAHVAAAAGPARAMRAAVSDSFEIARHVDGDRLDMLVANDGTLGFDAIHGVAGTWFPADSALTLMFDAGLWVAAKVHGQLRVAMHEYESQYTPGVMTGPSTWADPGDPRFVVYKVYAWRGDPQDTAHVERVTAAGARDALVHHSWSEYVNGAAPFGAPVRTWRLPNTATPDPSDSLDVPGPDVPGRQMLWCVYHDADVSRAQALSGRRAPLGVEVRQMLWTDGLPDPQGNVVFARWSITNRSLDTLTELHAAVWSDPDLGGAGDDAVGCDPSRALGFAYNRDDDDALYGNRPPAFGIDLLAGIPGAAGVAGFSSFRRIIGGDEPTTPQQTWNDMLGLLPDGSSLVNPITGDTTTWEDSGDPVAGSGWLDPDLTDKHILIGTGPGTLPPGASVSIEAAMIAARCDGALQSLSVLETNDDYLQAALAGSHDRPYLWCEEGPRPPPSPLSVNFWINPSARPTVLFTLTSASPARLDLFDLAGRRVWARTAAGAGLHVLVVDAALRPGVYLVQLEQDGRRARSKGVVVR